MKISLLLFLLILSQYLSAQSFSLADFDTIVSKQDQKLGLGGDAYRFIKERIDFASVYGSDDDKGKFRMKGETFKNIHTREILWTEIRESDTLKKIISCDMGYTAPAPVIRKMEQDLKRYGYKFRKREHYYIRRKNRQEYTIARIRKYSRYVSEFDTQPEIVFTAYKRLNKHRK